MLLAAAEYLARTRNFPGTAVVIFQPAEEGLGGGRAMIEDELFERFPCDEIYALHNMPLIPIGKAAVRPGAALASFDRFDVTVTGRGGHAAMPHTTIDPGLVMAHTVVGLQSLVSRQTDPLEAAVVSVTEMHRSPLLRNGPGFERRRAGQDRSRIRADCDPHGSRAWCHRRDRLSPGISGADQ